MNFKNATILLIFLLCVLGLIVGVYYTEVGEADKTLNEYDEAITEDSNGTITIDLENQKTSSLDKFFT